MKMFRFGLSVVCLAACVLSSFADEPSLPRRIFNETPEVRDARLGWWREGRFGMFIHFGLYAMPARGEWVRSREFIPNERYDTTYLPRFDPDLFDARAWAKAAKTAGMRYMVLTAKHHEGFCMWDTATTDYKITKTAFGRDLVREYIDACRAEGLGVGLYFSIIDWHHPDYLIDQNHPLRPRGGFTDETYAKANEGRDMARYRKYMWAQVRELLTQYGKIDIVWFDYTPKGRYGKTWRDWDAVNLLKMARELQPGLIVDSRLDLMETDDGWDFVTPEQFNVQSWPTVRGQRVPWEICQTFSGEWGYARDEKTWKSVPQLVRMLSEAVGQGGNLILNVGPTARGEFDGRAQERLAGLGRWMYWNARSIYGCTAAPEGFVAPNGTGLTYNPKTGRLYLHVYDYPPGNLPISFWEKVDYAQFLHDASEIPVRPPKKHHDQSGEQKIEYGGLLLPVLKPDVDVPVVEMFLKK